MTNSIIKISSLVWFVCMSISAITAQPKFKIDIEPTEVYGMPSLHSYAHAQWDGKWLILGGQTSEDWEFSHANLEIYVVDPAADQIWTMPTEYLYDQVQSVEQLTSCFAQFYQEGENLYMLGGYGYSPEIEGYYAFPYLSIINVKKVIQQVIAKDYQGAARYFRQLEDERFSVMDGMLTKIDNTFYLVGGIEFYGFFDEEDPSFKKQPRQEVISFQISQNREGLYEMNQIGSLDYTDEFLEIFSTPIPQIFWDESEGFSIITNEEIDGEEYVNWMDIFQVGYASSWQRTSKLAHYHSTTIPIFDRKERTMHTLFLNGCTEYLCEEEEITMGLETVDSMTVFSQSQWNSTITEESIAPYYNHAKDAQFILNREIPHYKNGVIKYHKLPEGKTHIGYIYGGASNANPMIFEDGSLLATSSSQLFKVYLMKEKDKRSL